MSYTYKPFTLQDLHNQINALLEPHPMTNTSIDVIYDRVAHFVDILTELALTEADYRHLAVVCADRSGASLRTVDQIAKLLEVE